MNLRIVTAIAVLVSVLTGCGRSAADLPLPWGGIAGETYSLTAVFSDALNLPTKAQVKLDGVRVGVVTAIKPANYTARVTFDVREDVKLPVGTRAELRQATPLGDVFLAVQPPDSTPGTPLLKDGDVLNLDDTTSAVSVEELLGAVSLLVNGGGLNQMGTIVRESNAALHGRDDTVKHLLEQSQKTVERLNARTDDIDRVLGSTRTLSRVAVNRQDTIDDALSEFPEAFAALDHQLPKLRRSLRAMDRTGDLANRLLMAAATDMVRMLRAIPPILAGFGDIGSRLAPTLRLMVELTDIMMPRTDGETLDGGAIMDFRSRPGTGNGYPDQADVQRLVEVLPRMIQDGLIRTGGQP